MIQCDCIFADAVDVECFQEPFDTCHQVVVVKTHTIDEGLKVAVDVEVASEIEGGL